MAVTEVRAYAREQVESLSHAITTSLSGQGIASHTAMFISNAIIFLLAVNIPLVLVALALFTSVLILFVFGTVAVFSAGVLALAITVVLGFCFLSLAMFCALVVTLFATISTVVACTFAFTFGLAVAVIGSKLTNRLRKVTGHLSSKPHGSPKVPVESGPASSAPARKVTNSDHIEQENSTITSDYSGSG